MNCKGFDEVIDLAFSNYGEVGVNVQLLSVQDTATEHGDWRKVMLQVAPVVPKAEPHAEIWYYGGVIFKETGSVPLGIRLIDKDKLIGCCEAAKKLPPGFPLDKASGSLYWVLHPSADEPIYSFHHEDKTFAVGAYSGANLGL